MDSLERLVVHVEEAVRLATMNDDPHLRLGLILLDSAAELLLHRECRSHLYRAKLAERRVAGAERLQTETGQEPEWLPGLREKIVSSAKRKKIDREFGAKCSYLADLGVLADPHARVLRKLHEYRNYAYHRDQLRLGTLASAVRIYTYLVCLLMRDFPQHGTSGFIHLLPRPSVRLDKYLQEGESVLAMMEDDGEEFQARIAARLLAEAGIAGPAGLGRVLSQHFCDRLDEVRDAAEESSYFFRRAGQDEGWGWETVLSLAQLGQTNLSRPISSDEVKAAVVAVRPARISQWQAEGEALATQADDLVAFATFADLEDDFEELEALVIKLATDVEGYSQLQYDFKHGY